MSDKAAKQQEMLAAGLFDKYLTERLAGIELPTEELFAACPEGQREELLDAISGADAYISQYLLSYVRPSVLQKLNQDIEAINRRTARQKELRQCAAAVWDLHTTDITPLLLHLINANYVGPSVASHPPTHYNRVYNRGESAPSARNKALQDQAWIRARKPILVAKAQEALDKAMIDTDKPVDLDRIAQRHYLVVEQGPMDGPIEGMLATDGEIGAILINTKIDNNHRRRFTFAHEIGHFILHKDKQSFQDTAEQLSDYTYSAVEAEANIFAAMLLMPPSLLPNWCGPEKPTLEQADDLTARFNVSFEASLRRMIDVSNWGTALVISKDGVITGCARSEFFNGYIPYGRKPHPHTIARLLLDTDGPRQDAAILPAEAWAEGPIVEENAQIHEQSRRLANGYVYSLLTVMDED